MDPNVNLKKIMIKKNKQLKLGFIGGGINSAIGHMHFSSSQMDGIWKVESGIFSENYNISQKTAKDWNIRRDRVYRNLDNFIKYEKNRLDAVVVILPIPKHFKVIEELLKNNIPVISEKTMIANLNEAKSIYKICKKNNSFLNVTYNYSGYPLIRELKARIKKGELGEIQQFHFEMPQDSFIHNINKKASHQKWRLKDKKIPTMILDLVAHLYSLCHFLIEKKPKKVFANFSNFSKFRVVDNSFIQLEFEKKIQGFFWASKVAHGSRNGLKIRIFGSKASAEWNHLNPEELKMSSRNNLYKIIDRASKKNYVAGDRRYNRFKAGHPAGFMEAFANIYFDIANSLRKYKKNKKYVNSYVFNELFELANMQVLTSATQSNKKRNWVKIR